MRFADEVHGSDGPGFARIDGFADAAIGEAMLDDVISLVQAANAGGDVGDALVLPEGQADLVDNDPENRVSKVFKLHRRPVFADFIRSPGVIPILCDTVGADADCFLSQFIFKNPGAW